MQMNKKEKGVGAAAEIGASAYLERLQVALKGVAHQDGLRAHQLQQLCLPTRHVSSSNARTDTGARSECEMEEKCM